jgi:AcrR family transcriptional regulator
MELRDRILQAAAALYAETGFRGATTRRIAERAGVNEITLFRHFGSKTRLLHEAVKCSGVSSNLCELTSRPSDPRAELTEWAALTLRNLHQHASLIRTAMAEIEERPDFLPPEQSPTLWATKALRRYLERLKEAGRTRAGIDLDAATTMFMGTLFADGVSRDIMNRLYAHSPEQSIHHYVELFLYALGVEEEKP